MLLLSLGAFSLLAFVQVSTTPPTPVAAPPASQATPPAKGGDVSTPTDPKERLEMGRKVNGLRGLAPLPWHLKASFEVFDQEGKSRDKGTYEEWRVNTKQYKLAFHSAELSLEEYGTDQGIFRTGGQDWPSSPAGRVRSKIAQPIPLRVGIANSELKDSERTFGSLKLPCTAVVSEGAKKVAEDADVYCFAATNGVLLYASSTKKAFQTLFQHISTIHGQYVARDVQEFLGGRPWLSIHVETAESLDPTHLPDLTVPASALPVNRRADGSEVVTTGRLIKSATPEYPLGAKAQHAEGVVMVSALVGMDGHVKKADVLAGPPLLHQAAMDAVRKWVYSPFLMDGEPVETEVLVRVEFRLGG